MFYMKVCIKFDIDKPRSEYRYSRLMSISVSDIESYEKPIPKTDCFFDSDTAVDTELAGVIM